MIAKNFEVIDENGLHALPAQMLAKVAKSVAFGVFFETSNAGRVAADNLLLVMSLHLVQGSRLRVLVDTPDAGEAELFFEEVEKILMPRRQI